MGRLDSYLRLLIKDSAPEISPLDPFMNVEHVNWEPAPVKVGVLLKFTGDLVTIEEAGFEPTSVIDDIAAGYIPLDRVEQIGALENVVLIEATRPLSDELDESIVEIEADHLHAALPPCRGAGVIIGIIDSGINYTHQCFRTEKGASRILAIWDQNIKPTREWEKPPEGFSYGVEYSREMIDEALALGDNCFEKVPHKDKRGHGTMVAGVAAGNGLAPGIASARRKVPLIDGNEEWAEVDIIRRRAAGTYVGVAPDADILVVAYDEGKPMGDSLALHGALQYMIQKAEAMGRPIVINLSQGDSIGAHDGTSNLEQAIDRLLSKPGRAIVKSAGNIRRDKDNGTLHASGTLKKGETVILELQVPGGDTRLDIIDIWYSGSDLFDVAIIQPDDKAAELIPPNTRQENLPMPNGNEIWIESTTNDPDNHDNRILMKLKPGKLGGIQQGKWGIALTGREVSGDGCFHAWINFITKDPVPTFQGKYANNSCVITIPGTSEKIITVGTYNTRFAPDDKPDADQRGSLAPYTSLGPTRDGRTKPEIVAPGQCVVTPRADPSEDKQYNFMGGTSMSAPHVAGAIALMLEKNRNLTQTDIKEILCRFAQRDEVPDSERYGWGAGKLKLKEPFDALS
jgi:subtilisin family serine protease